jgi:hypothetical protein
LLWKAKDGVWLEDLGALLVLVRAYSATSMGHEKGIALLVGDDAAEKILRDRTRIKREAIGRAAGGRARAQQRREESQKNISGILDEADRLLDNGSMANGIPTLIVNSKKYGSRPTVLKALRDHKSGHWKKKK